ncbi:MAG: hypothetical protein ABIF40_04845 [archaeon]
MNKDQLAYLFGTLVNLHSEIVVYSITIGVVSLEYIFFDKIDLDFYKTALPLGTLTFGLIMSREFGKDKLKVKKMKKMLKANHEKYPRQDYERIVFEYRDGLEMLLSETAKKGKYEWGTCYKYSSSENDAVITDILSLEESKEKKFVTDVSESSVQIEYNFAKTFGYNGHHHYHPKTISNGLDAANFVINQRDRSIADICLLTFMLNGRPEIIGYNLLNTYIPTDASKTVLTKATWKDIYRYLGK